MKTIKSLMLALSLMTGMALLAFTPQEQAIQKAIQLKTDPYGILNEVNGIIQKTIYKTPDANPATLAFAVWQSVLSNKDVVKTLKGLDVVAEIMKLPNNYLQFLQFGQLYQTFVKTKESL